MARAEAVDVVQLYRTFITASHILHHHGVLDAFGHISVRHPQKPNVFIMSQFIAPALIASPNDLIEYYVDDASPVDPSAGKGYSERCIHSEVLKRYPNMNSVIHSHSEAILPYAISGVPLRPCYHMAGFLGHKVPIYDIAKWYQEDDRRDMLVSNTRLGAALADHFMSSKGASSSGHLEPEHTVVLMRGHGLTVVGASIQQAVSRAIYTQKNAIVQTTSLSLRNAFAGQTTDEGLSGQGIQFLGEDEATDSRQMNDNTVGRPWGLWVREVESQKLYVNLA
ncbi:MAG: hypothetical protein M1827_002987 [Pycnora praestabilis]|nr:MAG: hypothetical protein M1827_002987 [Pycnora praestabilis]